MNTCALVTGAQGFVGRYLVAEMLKAYPDAGIIGIGRSERSAGFTHPVTWHGQRVFAPLPGYLQSTFEDSRYTYLQIDVRSRRELCRVLRKFRPETVIHLASGLRDDSPQHLFGSNVQGTIELLEGVHDAAIRPRLIIASSGSVYGSVKELPISEDLPCEPQDFYAVSKLAQEHVARIVARERQLHVSYARIFNIVGPGENERHVAGRFAAQIAAIAAGTSEPRLQIGDLSTTRDFIDVRDVARALIVLSLCAQPGQIYNVASGAETPIRMVLDSLIRAAGLGGRVEIDASYVRVSDIPRIVANTARLRALGFGAAITLERSLFDVLDYYRQTVGTATPAPLPAFR